MIKIKIPDNIEETIAENNSFTTVPTGVYTVEAIEAINRDKETNFPIQTVIKTDNKKGVTYRKPGRQVGFKLLSGKYEIPLIVDELRETYKICLAFGGNLDELPHVPPHTAGVKANQKYLGIIESLANNGNKTPTIEVNESGYGKFWKLSNQIVPTGSYFMVATAINRRDVNYLKPIKPIKDLRNDDRYTFNITFMIVADGAGDLFEFAGCYVDIGFNPYGLSFDGEVLEFTTDKNGNINADGRRMYYLLETCFPPFFSGNYIPENPKNILPDLDTYLRENPIPFLGLLGGDVNNIYQKFDSREIKPIKDKFKEKVYNNMKYLLGLTENKNISSLQFGDKKEVTTTTKSVNKIGWAGNILKDFIEIVFKYGYEYATILDEYPKFTIGETKLLKKWITPQAELLKKKLGVDNLSFDKLTPEQILNFIENVDLPFESKTIQTISPKIETIVSELRDTLIKDDVKPKEDKLEVAF